MDRVVSARRHAPRIPLLSLLSLLALPAAAQPVDDPTKPPAALLLQAGGAPAASPVIPAPVLQSVLISGNGRKVAVINGKVVRIGERFGDAHVVGMTQTTVALRRGMALETLKLFSTPQAGRAETAASAHAQ